MVCNRCCPPRYLSCVTVIDRSASPRATVLKMNTQRERDVIYEFIELYKDMPCLWDLSSDSYKDTTQKRSAWDILVLKLKEIDPKANEASAKKKIDNLKSSYQRELKKINDSKNRTGSSGKNIHKPNLWYFNLMKFLDIKNKVRRVVVDSCMISNDEEDDPDARHITKKKDSKERALEVKEQKLIDTAQSLLNENRKEVNYFGIYVGEQLDKISSGQREIAEKLISDVIFLAKTHNLNFESHIETSGKSRYHPSHSYTPPYNPSPNFIHSRSSTSQSSQSSTNAPSNRDETSPFGHIIHPTSPPLWVPINKQSPPLSSQIQQNPHPPSSLLEIKKEKVVRE